MSFFTYISYAFSLVLNANKASSVAATLEFSGHDMLEVSEIERSMTKDYIVRTIELFKQAPPCHISNVEQVRALLAPYKVPPLLVIAQLQSVFVEGKASRFLNYSLEELRFAVSIYDNVEEDNFTN